MGGNTNGIQVTLTDFGTDGATPETFAQRSYFPANSVPVIQDGTVWAGFGMSFAKGHGNDRSDNFSIAQVPEPATGLIGLMAAGALTAVRRRGIGRRN